MTFSILTPAWENNDEAAHVQYIEHIVRYGTPPQIAASNGVESHQPPLYYYLSAAWQKLLGIPAFDPQIEPPLGPPIPATQRFYEVSHDYSPAQHRAARAVHELRLVSVVCGLVAVLAAVAAGGLLTGRALTSGAIGATVALWPKFLVVTSAVTNSALVTMIGAVAVPIFLIWRRRQSWKWAGLLGAVLGAGALTDETALPVAALMILLLGIYCVRSRHWSSIIAAVMGFGLVAGGWLVREWVIYGDPLASSKSRTYLLGAIPGLVRAAPHVSWAILRAAWPQLAQSTWYDGGWNQLLLPPAVDHAVWVLAVVSIVAALASRLPERWILLASAGGSIGAWLAIVRATTGAQGRYLLVGIVAWATLLVLGAERVMRGLRLASFVWPAVMTSLVCYVLLTWVIPYAHL